MPKIAIFFNLWNIFKEKWIPWIVLNSCGHFWYELQKQFCLSKNGQDCLKNCPLVTFSMVQTCPFELSTRAYKTDYHIKQSYPYIALTKDETKVCH